MRGLTGVIIAAVVAIVIAVVVFRNLETQTPAPATAQTTVSAPEVKSVNIFVASQPIPLGTVVTQEMLAIQPWPEHLLLDGFVKADGGAQNVIGFVVRSPFQQQEPIITSKLAKPSDPNFLAGELPKGMRVVTIITNETEGVAGFLFPGDHVDVILTHDVEYKDNVMDPATLTPKEQTRKSPVTETLLTNVTVMAVDQRATGAKATDSEGKLIVPRSVSVMVSPTDAQRIRLGQKVGTLTLALRSLADRESADPITITEEKDISQFKKPENQQTESLGEIKIYRGIENSALKQSTMGAPASAGSMNNNAAPGASPNSSMAGH